jgi:hypothetical protein
MSRGRRVKPLKIRVIFNIAKIMWSHESEEFDQSCCSAPKYGETFRQKFSSCQGFIVSHTKKVNMTSWFDPLWFDDLKGTTKKVPGLVNIQKTMERSTDPPFLMGKPWENHWEMVIYMERSTMLLKGIHQLFRLGHVQ